MDMMIKPSIKNGQRILRKMSIQSIIKLNSLIYPY
jgi:hypothetical protein